jgi:hypothetical protein
LRTVPRALLDVRWRRRVAFFRAVGRMRRVERRVVVFLFAAIKVPPIA